MMTKELLHKHFDYADGKLTRKDFFRKQKTNKQKSEYPITMFLGKVYKTHRLIYLYHYGCTPKQIDHIDGDKYNNRIENLRECTPSNNSMNVSIKANNTSGVKNVTWDSSRNKWRTRICAGGKIVLSDRFEDKELAELVAIMAREKYHHTFANHGV